MIISYLEGLILDFDGVFTNNQLSTNSNYEEAIISSKDDSIALKALFNMTKGMNLNFKVIVISGEKNKSIINRCNKLNLNCLNGIEEKLETAKKQFKDLKKVLYIGNDINDFSTMAACGLRWCPNDANPLIIQLSSRRLKKKGGNGCIREVINKLSDGMYKYWITGLESAK